MPAKKNTKLKSKKAPLGNRKRAGIILAAFAVVGAVVLIRSFASTVVMTINYANAFTNKDPKLGLISKGGNPPTVVSEPDGKKTVSYLEVKSGDDGVGYNYKLFPGYYQACFKVKPITAGAKATLRSVLVGSTTAEPITRTITENGGADYKLNTFKETCVNILSRDQNAELSSMFLPNGGDWRLASLTIKTLDQSSEAIDLSSAFSSKDPRFTFTGASVHYDSTRGKNVLKVDPYGRVNFKITDLKHPLVNGQVTAKAAGTNAKLAIGVMRDQKGGEQEIVVNNAHTSGSTYNVLTTNSYNIMGFFPGATDITNVSASNPLTLIVGSNAGTVYLDQLYFTNASYSSTSY